MRNKEETNPTFLGVS